MDQLGKEEWHPNKKCEKNMNGEILNKIHR